MRFVLALAVGLTFLATAGAEARPGGAHGSNFPKKEKTHQSGSRGHGTAPSNPQGQVPAAPTDNLDDITRGSRIRF
jgi:hypothetical protein